MSTVIPTLNRTSSSNALRADAVIINGNAINLNNNSNGSNGNTNVIANGNTVFRHVRPFIRPWNQPRKVSICDKLMSRQQFMDQLAKEKILFHNEKGKILVGLIFQYVHSVATNVAYYMHIPREPLADLGMSLLPELGPEKQIISEYMFFALFISTIVFALSPLFLRHDRSVPLARRRFATLIFARFLCVCALAQSLRIVSFLVTSLPGPNYHCHPNSPAYDPPKNLGEIFSRQDPFTHCGDLVFSSHTIFVVLCALTWNKYAILKLWQRVAMWCLVPIFGGLVVAAHKHYSLDVVVAMYTVPLLWIACGHHFPDKIPLELSSSSNDLNNNGNDITTADEIECLSPNRTHLSSLSSLPPIGELPLNGRIADDLESGLLQRD